MVPLLDCETGVLTTRPRRLVVLFNLIIDISVWSDFEQCATLMNPLFALDLERINRKVRLQFFVAFKDGEEGKANSDNKRNDFL